MQKDKYDYIICGAGPVGLAAAITACRLGAKAIILEKGERAGPEPRGESMIAHSIVKEILGENWLEDNCSTKPSKRMFHSPMDRKKWLIDAHQPYYFFDWFDLIDHLVNLAIRSGAEIKYEAEVVSYLKDNNRIIGVEYIEKSGNKKRINGVTVINSMGHTSPAELSLGINRDEIDCPTIKYLSNNAPAVSVESHPNIQFYLIPPKLLDYAPKLPPAVAYVFPLSNGKMEAGLMIRLSTLDMHKNVKVPSKDELLKIWDNLVSSYPGFSDFFKGADTSYKEVTVICNRKLVDDITPEKGLIFLGDLVGFSEANGSSGLFFGIAQANFWVKETYKRFTDDKIEWENNQIKDLNKKYRKWDVYKHILKSYKDITLAERLIFKTFGKDKSLNRWWKLMMNLVQLKT